jgi:ERCC4-type nuclease
MLNPPTIVIDSREQTPLSFDNLPTASGSLYSGDYSVLGLEHKFAIERKSIADLVGSITSGRERFERELHRLRGFDFKRLLIVGSEDDIKSHNYRSKASPNSVLGSLYTFEVRYGIPVIWGIDEQNSSILVERWAARYAREIDKLALWRGE